jgi:hypothetical protein
MRGSSGAVLFASCDWLIAVPGRPIRGTRSPANASEKEPEGENHEDGSEQHRGPAARAEDRALSGGGATRRWTQRRRPGAMLVLCRSDDGALSCADACSAIVAAINRRLARSIAVLVTMVPSGQAPTGGRPDSVGSVYVQSAYRKSAPRPASSRCPIRPIAFDLPVWPLLG